MNLANPYLPEEDEAFYFNVKKFSVEKILPSVLEREETCVWSEPLWNEVCNAELAGPTIPEEYGGQGANCYQTLLAGEAVVAGSADGGFMLSWGASFIIGAMPIVLFGTEEQKKKYLPGIASGNTMAGLGLTEPGSGSDAAAMATFAEETPDGFILNGSKMFITNGSIGKVFVIMARTKKSRGPMGVSAFIVESDRKGFKVGKVLRKLGHHTSSTSELVFEDLHLPKENLLGPLHSGFMRIGKETLEWERAALGAGNIGSMQFNLERGMSYSHEREQFGKPIFSFFKMKEILVKNWIYLQAARRYAYYLAKKKDEGEHLPLQSSVLKLLSSEVAEEVAHESVQLHGGYGYMKEYHVERIYRDIKLGTIGGGTSEVQKSIIAAVFPGQGKEKTIFTSIASEEDIEKAASNANSEELKKAIYFTRGLINLVCSVSGAVKKKKSQLYGFAFADMVCIASWLWQTLAESTNDSSVYSRESKQRDYCLLTVYLAGRYLRSLQVLHPLADGEVENLVSIYLSFEERESFIESCAGELSSSFQ